MTFTPPPRRDAFKQQAFRMGQRPGLALDKALQIASLLDDAEVARKLTETLSAGRDARHG
jgi:hypothetical protein